MTATGRPRALRLAALVGVTALLMGATSASASSLSAPPVQRGWPYAVPSGWQVDDLVPGPHGAVYLLLDAPTTGAAELVSLHDNGQLAWRRSVGAIIAGGGPSGPLVGPDGTVYQELYRSSPGPAEVVALSPAGRQRWLFSAPRNEALVAPAAIGANGAIYLGFDGGIWALSAAGKPQWLFHTPPGPSDDYHPLVQPLPGGGVLAVNDALGRSAIYLLAADGRLQRQQTFPATTVPNWGLASSRVGTDGTVYLNTRSGIEALGPNGKVRWRSRLGGSPAAVGADGTCYVQAIAADGRSETVTALAPGGRVRFTRQTALRTGGLAPPWPTLAPGGQGTLYQLSGASPLRLDALNRSGSVLWTIDLPAGAEAAGPVLGRTGTLYLLVTVHGTSRISAYRLTPS